MAKNETTIESVSATIKDGKLVLTIPLDKNPAPSSSGKTLLLASSRGNFDTGCDHGGKRVKIGFNVFVPNK